jgi:hypothetical protein
MANGVLRGASYCCDDELPFTWPARELVKPTPLAQAA